jgi:hypothetical protein
MIGGIALAAIEVYWGGYWLQRDGQDSIRVALAALRHLLWLRLWPSSSPASGWSSANVTPA